MKRFIFLSFLLWLSSPIAAAQGDTVRWTLSSCLDYALENNIQIRRGEVALLSGIEDTREARAQLFPSLSASVSQSVVSYPSAEASGSNSYTGNYGLSAQWTIFNGLTRRKAIEQSELQNRIDEASVEENRDEIRIAIVQAYLQVMYAFEAVRIAENTVQVSEAELERSKGLFDAGALSRAEYAQIESQLAGDRYQLVAAQASLDNYKLQLKQLLEIDIDDEMLFASSEVSETEVMRLLPDKAEVYRVALETKPQMTAARLGVESSELSVEQAKGGYLPTLALSASVGTGHLSGGEPVGTQMWNRLNGSAGLTLSIPIASNRKNRTAVNKAQLAVTDSELELLSTEKELLKTVEGIWLDAISAQSQYVSAVEKVRAAEESYALVREQFDLGMSNTLELLTQQNNLLSAQQEMLQSKYMAVMNIQLLNIYQNLPVDGAY